jgi:hypothetical protein
MSPNIRIDYIGAERQPVIVIDDFVADVAAMRAEAEALNYEVLGEFYPGIRAPVPPATLSQFMPPIIDLIGQTFGFGGHLNLINAAYSIVTTSPADLAPIQRLPHYDGLDAERIALLHYLSPAAQGGTAFFRHRTTGYETVSQARYPRFAAELERDVARHGLPAPSYISGDTEIFEQIASYEARVNRALIYRGHALHCGIIPADQPLSADPRYGRLTVNTFLFGTN